MKPVAEAKVRSRLLGLRASLEGQVDHETPSGLKRSRLGSMQHQLGQVGDETKRVEEIKRVDAALARLDERKYGYCTNCGATIEDRRLQADPAVSLCGKCGGDQQ